MICCFVSRLDRLVCLRVVIFFVVSSSHCGAMCATATLKYVDLIWMWIQWFATNQLLLIDYFVFTVYISNLEICVVGNSWVTFSKYTFIFMIPSPATLNTTQLDHGGIQWMCVTMPLFLRDTQMRGWLVASIL